MAQHQPSPGPRSAKRVMPAMGFAVVALAFASIFISELERAEVAPLVIAFYRMAIATLLVLPAAVAFKWSEIAALPREHLGMLALSGFCLALHFGAWITSLKYIPIATAVVLVNSHPLFIVIASYVFLGERPPKRTLVATAIGLVGMVIIGHSALADFRMTLKGDALALAGALAIVGYFIVGRRARARMSLLGYVTPVYVVCSVSLLVWVLAVGDSLTGYGASVWVYLVALAVVPTIIGHTIFNWALKYLRPTAISVAFLGEPVVASVLALVLFGQRPPLTTFIGGALVLVGVYLAASK